MKLCSIKKKNQNLSILPLPGKQKRGNLMK